MPHVKGVAPKFVYEESYLFCDFAVVSCVVAGAEYDRARGGEAYC